MEDEAPQVPEVRKARANRFSLFRRTSTTSDLIPEETRRSSLSRLINSVNNVSDTIAQSRNMIALSTLSTVACSAAIFGVVFAANEYSKETKSMNTRVVSRTGELMETKTSMRALDAKVLDVFMRYECDYEGDDKRLSQNAASFYNMDLTGGQFTKSGFIKGNMATKAGSQLRIAKLIFQDEAPQLPFKRRDICFGCCGGCIGAGLDCGQCCDCCCQCCGQCGGPSGCGFSDYFDCWNVMMEKAMATGNDAFKAKCDGCCCCCCCCCCCGDLDGHWGNQGTDELDDNPSTSTVHDSGVSYNKWENNPYIEGDDLEGGGPPRRGLEGACKGRGLEGACKGRGLEGACKGRSLEGACKGRSLEGACKGRGLAGGCKGRGLTGACKGRNLEGACKGRDLEGACKGRHLTCKGRDLMGTERDLEGACKGRHVLENPDMFSEANAQELIDMADPCIQIQEKIQYVIPQKDGTSLIKTTLGKYFWKDWMYIDEDQNTGTALVLGY